MEGWQTSSCRRKWKISSFKINLKKEKNLGLVSSSLYLSTILYSAYMVWTDQATSTAITANTFLLQLSDGIINYLGTFSFLISLSLRFEMERRLLYCGGQMHTSCTEGPAVIQNSVSHSVVILDIKNLIDLIELLCNFCDEDFLFHFYVFFFLFFF